MVICPANHHHNDDHSVIVDAVINHMTGHGASGTGTGGSGFDGGSERWVDIIGDHCVLSVMVIIIGDHW